jgi:CheY-like chemotaxis protein
LQRQRDEVIRQRDEAARKMDLLNRKVTDSATHSAEVQKQLMAIRQARDASHAQSLELTNKVARGEDAIAELEYQREAARKAHRQAQSEASEYRRQLETVTLDRDATARQIEDLTQELDEQRKKLLDLAEQRTAEVQADSEHASALLEARAQVTSLVQERDSARARAQEQARELEDLRAQFEAFREEAQSTGGESENARGKVAALESEIRNARHATANYQQLLMAAEEKLAALQQTVHVRALEHAAERAELEALRADREAALTSLNAAHKQIEHIIRERDAIRQRSTESTIEAEAQIAALALRVKLAEHEQADLAAKDHQIKQAATRFEAQRLEMIDLAAQFQDAHRQIRELSANLAEARLQVRFASSTARAAKSSPAKVAELATLANELAASGSSDLGRTGPLPLGGEEILTEKQARHALTAMRNCYQSFSKTPSDLSLLNELYCHAHSFSERARTTGYLALHRLCHAFASLTHGLYQAPEQINVSTLRTVQQTIDFLGTLMREKDPSQFTDPAKAHVYMVDDDADNCHCVEMVLAEQTIKTHSAQEPSYALMELASQPFDLIFLDVNMPEMDGFELCRQIRDLPFHATTPIVFLTGLATPENRDQSAISGGTDFIGKPFNLHELSVKTLTLILKQQLQPE